MYPGKEIYIVYWGLDASQDWEIIRKTTGVLSDLIRNMPRNVQQKLSP